MIFYVTIIFFLGLFLFKCFWSPYKRHKWYAHNFQRQGYKVLEVPFKPLSITAIRFYDWREKVSDALENMKAEYPHYDVVIMNIFNITFLNFIHPDLVQKFVAAENLENIKKIDI